MKENISDLFSRFLLNSVGFLMVLFTPFIMPFSLIFDLIKYIFPSKHSKQEKGSILSISLQEGLIGLGVLIIFIIFSYFSKKFWYLFFILPIPLGLLESIGEIILKKHETFLSILQDDTLCGTPKIQMEHPELIKTPNFNAKHLSEEEKIKLFERMGFKRKNILKHLNEK